MNAVSVWVLPSSSRRAIDVGVAGSATTTRQAGFDTAVGYRCPRSWSAPESAGWTWR